MKSLSKVRVAVQIATLLFLSITLFTLPNLFKPLFLTSILILGVFHCGWLCPLGLLQDLSSKLGRKMGIVKKKVPNALHSRLLYIRYILAVIVLVSVSDLVFSFLSFEPLGTLNSMIYRHIPNFLAIGLLVLFIVLALFFERPYCRYFCFEGAKLGFFSLFRIFTVNRNPISCVQCKICDTACPMQIKVTKVDSLRSPQCINCFNCIAVCPIKGALTYGNRVGG